MRDHALVMVSMRLGLLRAELKAATFQFGLENGDPFWTHPVKLGNFILRSGCQIGDRSHPRRCERAEGRPGKPVGESSRVRVSRFA